MIQQTTSMMNKEVFDALNRSNTRFWGFMKEYRELLDEVKALNAERAAESGKFLLPLTFPHPFRF